MTTTTFDEDGKKYITTITTTTTDNGDCTETVEILKRMELFTPLPESRSLGFIEGVISEVT